MKNKSPKNIFSIIVLSICFLISLLGCAGNTNPSEENALVGQANNDSLVVNTKVARIEGVLLDKGGEPITNAKIVLSNSTILAKMNLTRASMPEPAYTDDQGQYIIEITADERMANSIVSFKFDVFDALNEHIGAMEISIDFKESKNHETKISDEAQYITSPIIEIKVSEIDLEANANNTSFDQYTPDQANWETFSSKPLASGTNKSHDPDGIGWMNAEGWAAAEWDGTVYNPSQMTKEEFVTAICPSVDRVRGIREVFYQHNPFADNTNPTKAEVDEWHRIAINHVRALIGYTSEDRQVKKDHCMFARALWGDERKFTTMWDDKYPGVLGSAAGPCEGSGNAHCGATFIPDLEDQALYLPSNHTGCSAQQGAEGVFSGPKSNIPWSVKWSRALCNTLMAEGFWGGHVGPWFHREKFGFSFWDNDPSNNNNNAILRAKWTGNLMPNLYCNPSDPNCDPNNTGVAKTKLQN